jgi:hypothetical protein
LGRAVFVSPNTFDTFSSILFKSLAEWINFNTFEEVIDVLFVGTDFVCRCAFSGNRFFDRADAGCTGSSVSYPLFAFVVDFIAGKGGFVEESSSSAVKWGSVTDTVIESVSNGALAAFSEIVIDVASDRVIETLSVFFVLTGRAFVLDTFSRYESVSSVTGCTGSEDGIVNDTGESGEVSLEVTTFVYSCSIGIIRNIRTIVDLGEIVHSVDIVSSSCPNNLSSCWRFQG